jgi:hypothetical protein
LARPLVPQHLVVRKLRREFLSLNENTRDEPKKNRMSILFAVFNFVAMAAVNLDENDLSAVQKLLLDSGYTPMVT